MDNRVSDNFRDTTGCCMFRRRSASKKQRIIDELLATNQHLSGAIAACSQTNTSLFERVETKKRECQELKQKLQTLNEELNRKNDSLNSTSESLERKTKKCQSQLQQVTDLLFQKDTAEKTAAMLRATKDSLEKELKARIQNLKEVKALYEKLAGVMANKQEEIRRHTLENKSIQLKLQDSEKTVKKMKNKWKNMSSKIKEKEDAYATLQNALAASEARQMVLEQHKLTCTASSLANVKMELVKVLKSLQLKKESISRLKEQKAQLLTYIHDKEAAFEIQLQAMHDKFKSLRNRLSLNDNDLQCLTLTPDTKFSSGTIMKLGETVVIDAAKPIACIEYLQTKVMELELKLFRRDKLIEVLEERIASLHPGFSILTQPHLYAYLDDSKHVSNTTMYGINDTKLKEVMIEDQESYEQLGDSRVGLMLSGDEESDGELTSDTETHLDESNIDLLSLTQGEELMLERRDMMAQEWGKQEWKYEDSIEDEAYQSMYVDPYDSQDSNGNDTITVGSAEFSESDIN